MFREEVLTVNLSCELASRGNSSLIGRGIGIASCAEQISVQIYP